MNEEIEIYKVTKLVTSIIFDFEDTDYSDRTTLFELDFLELLECTLESFSHNNFLSEEELNIVMCARNHKNNHKPKYTDIITYKKATGLEALIGYLYFEKNIDRINEIMDFIVRR